VLKADAKMWTPILVALAWALGATAIGFMAAILYVGTAPDMRAEVFANWFYLAAPIFSITFFPMLLNYKKKIGKHHG
jgi:ABC-type nickel/cobalt efflux system permease component RcnA